MKALILYLATFLASGQVVQQGLVNAPPPSAPVPAACGSAISNVLSDYWAGSLSTSPVTANWPDSIGSNPVGPTANPTWANNTFGTGLSGVTLNGSSQYFSATVTSWPTSSYANLSGYAVVKTGPSFSGGTYLLSNHLGGSSNALAWGVNASSQVQLDKQSIVGICHSTATLSANTIYEIYFDYNGTTCHIYINGSLDSTTSNSQTIASGEDRIGVNFIPGASQYWNGSIYEMILSSNTSYQAGAHSCWVALGLP